MHIRTEELFVQPHEYVELIKFALRIEGNKHHPSIKIYERVTERTTEEWSISPGNRLLTYVHCGNEKFLKKLIKILKEADIAHEVDRPVYVDGFWMEHLQAHEVNYLALLLVAEDGCLSKKVAVPFHIAYLCIAFSHLL